MGANDACTNVHKELQQTSYLEGAADQENESLLRLACRTGSEGNGSPLAAIAATSKHPYVCTETTPLHVPNKPRSHTYHNPFAAEMCS